MKLNNILLIILFFFTTSINAQFTVTLQQPDEFHCTDTTLEFVAIVTNNGAFVEDVNFTWSFGDETSELSGLNQDTVEHKYEKGGGYIIRVDVEKDGNKDYALLKCEIAFDPNFSGTNSDKEDPICLGDRITLTGKVNDSTWFYNIPDTINHTTPIEFNNTTNYSGDFDYRIFSENQFITSALDIDSIGIELEHSNLSHVKIELICPNGNSVILKDFGGSEITFGEPNPGNVEGEYGTPYLYYFTNNPTNGTMNSISSGTSLPAGSYTSEESFNNLIGCPLNGLWQIKISDNTDAENGFIFFTRLSFEESLLPGDWEYSHTYTFGKYNWTGDGYISSTNQEDLNALAIPDKRRTLRYYFNVEDDFGCPQDTFVDVTVEAASITNPTDGYETDFINDINFSTETSWATSYEWDFGDPKEDDVEATIENSITHTYNRDGTFRVKLTALSETGCSDTTSIIVVLTIPESNLDNVPNAFTPNGDDKNPLFEIDENLVFESFECLIYNRWGKKMVHWRSLDDAKKGWDGKTEGGRDAPPGVYFYYMKAKKYTGEEIDKSGSIHLFR